MKLRQVFPGSSTLPRLICIAMVTFATGLMAYPLSGKLFSSEPPHQGEGREACGGDVMSHCGSYLVGRRHHIRSCLREHLEELAPDCRQFIIRADAFERQMIAHCGSDLETHCGDHQGKPDEMRVCIRENFGNFRPGCQDFLEATYGGPSE